MVKNVEEVKESLEKRSKELLKLQVMKKFKERPITFSIQDFGEDIPALNYLFGEGYTLEKGFTVKEFHYEITPYGIKWALG